MEEVTATVVMEGAVVGPEVAEATTAEKKGFKVVVAVDDSENSHYALSWAIDNILANRREDCQLVVLHVQHFVETTFMYPVAGHAVYAPTLSMDAVRKAHEENSKRVISRAVDICKSKHVDALTAVAEGDPKDAICEAAEKLHADLLVVGSRGLGMIKRAFLGSVSDYLAHHAKCPVLIVKPPKGSHK
ncbi:Adenine nucleotide alpha hydrolases-like superfamily protein [Rhynchospora pubera]|uniref:Adenine nucleotide alpha hydrolases-like superfamily protein n=1 Tax=Rhynchospora pubera TaxID=906938 RepID=A0AAV8FF57_9POAL|nr:Adenine nucleotide alpha hydrolases-like superfamily protein [Rhynchospora pubera]